jgi:hypothetical protein
MGGSDQGFDYGEAKSRAAIDGSYPRFADEHRDTRSGRLDPDREQHPDRSGG